MFKKSLVAVAALATFSAGAMAANVELYGVVDMGFSYTHTSHQEKGDKFEMSQNMYAGSRFGFRGTEDLGDDLTVGFILENGFTPDTGAMAVSDTIFNRESQLYLKGSWVSSVSVAWVLSRPVPLLWAGTGIWNRLKRVISMQASRPRRLTYGV